MKKIHLPLLFALAYFACVGVGVLLGNLIDNTGNMFYAPACSALVGGFVYWYFVDRLRRFGAITFVGLVLGAFFLMTRHGAGAFLPAIVCGILADGLAYLGRYKDKLERFVSFLVFAFATTGPILMMWLDRQAYVASLLARGKSQAYIDRIMVDFTLRNVLFLVVSTVIGAFIGAWIGKVFMKWLNKRQDQQGEMV